MHTLLPKAIDAALLTTAAFNPPPFSTYLHATAYRQLKRLPRQPKEAFTVSCDKTAIPTVQPIPFVDLV